MAFNIDPFQAYLTPPEVPGSTEPMTEEERIKRQERLTKLGLQDGMLGRLNDQGLKNAVARSGMKEGLSSGVGSWASSL